MFLKYMVPAALTQPDNFYGCPCWAVGFTSSDKSLLNGGLRSLLVELGDQRNGSDCTNHAESDTSVGVGVLLLSLLLLVGLLGGEGYSLSCDDGLIFFLLEDFLLERRDEFRSFLVKAGLPSVDLGRRLVHVGTEVAVEGSFL